jgi:hypothetical protein
MKSTKPNPNSEILVRTFASSYNNQDLQAKVVQAIETNPALNNCFTSEESAGYLRISGLDLRGDILLRSRSKGKSRKVDVFFRRGDRAIFNALTESLSKGLSLIETDRTCRSSRLAEYIQGDSDIMGLGKIIFTDAAIDSAMLCNFSETDKLIEFSISLRSMSRNISEGVLGEREENLPAHEPAARDYVSIYLGRKVRLTHRITLMSRRSDLNLTVHFTWLPKEKAFLVGWFSESINA